jgi:N-sulfoglucosamine sulfohydrolase
MPRPNIVFMISHDLGRHLGCYGVPTVNSPSIDQLAADGVRFTNHFCTAPSCSPSRASIFTGRYPHNNGVMGLCHADFAWDLHPDESHLAGILREAGYRTALIGLQHETRRVEDMGWEERLPGGPCDEVAERAAQWIEHARDTQPFYAQIGFFEPHRDFDYGGALPDDSKGVTVPPWLADEPTARQEFAAFQGAIRKMDAAVGTVLDALEGAGLLQNTLVVFTTDHGIPFPRAKCSLYDPGISTAFILRWPERGWAGGKTYSELVSNIDNLPTLLDAAGIEMRKNVQGRSFAPLLDGKEYQPRDVIFAEMTYHDYFDPRRCIRTPKYKLIANFTTAPFFMNPTQTWRPMTITKNPDRPMHAYHPHLELYDLEHDPLEFDNLAGRPEYAEVENSLAARLLTWMEETSDPLVGGPPPSPHHTTTMARLQQARDQYVG